MLVNLLTRIANWCFFSIARIRAGFWKLFVKNMGHHVYIMSHCILTHPNGIEIGNYVLIGHYSSIAGHGGVSIGNHVLIGSFCSILSVTHKYQDWKKTIWGQGDEIAKVVIEDDVWIGVHVTILPNITIGHGAVIGANSVVTKNIKPFDIVGGVPAKFIKSRKPDNRYSHNNRR